MFCICFGWRKASKCMKLIKRLQWRLDLLKIKRHSMIKQLRQDIAQLIKLGHQQTAFNRAHQLFKDECALAVYEMLHNFSEFIILNLSYIRKHKDIPNDVNEAVSSLVFASARCGDLPELLRIRELFGKRYGPRFAAAAVDLRPGNLVNHEMRKKLSADEVSDEVKYELVDAIAKDYCLRPEVILSLEYHSESKHHQEQQPEHQVSKVADNPNSEFISSSVHSNKEEMDSESRKIHKPIILSSSESSSPYDFHEEMVVYVDDIEEFGTDGVHRHQDQRLFKFKPLLPVSREKGKSGDQYESWYCSKNPVHDEHSSRVEEEMAAAERDVKVEEDYSPKYSSSSSSTSEDYLVPPHYYSRAMTMPQQRTNDDNQKIRESFLRSISCPIQQQSSHVHPKLPNYDEIAAKFSALKMERLRANKPCNDPL